MADSDYDVVVVGARVAGAILAALLGAAGCRVLLVDRARFPSPTLSTHFFRGAGLVAVLARLGLLARVLALGCPPLVREYSYAGGADAPAILPPQEPGASGHGLSLRREPLDHLLVRHAADFPSVDVLAETRLRDLLWADGRVTGARLATAAGERMVRARILVGADGRHSAVARAVRAPVDVEDAPVRGIFYRYVTGFPAPDGATPDGPEFSRRGDEIAYVFPSDAGVTCVALSVNLADFAAIRSAPELHMRERLAGHRGLWERFAAAAPLGGQLGCGPERGYVRVPVGPGWALVGDAGLHQDPWSGFGMDYAGVHATFLAEALIDWLTGSTPEDAALTEYHRRRNEHGLPGYRRTMLIGRDLRQLDQLG